MKRLSVVGLGKLGACITACCAARGFETLGIDMDKAKVDAMNNGKAPVLEANLEEMIRAAGNRLRASTNLEEAIEASETTLIIVPTPSQPDDNFSAKYVRAVLEVLGAALKKSSKPDHLFVVVSTVSPGTCGEELIPLLEKTSGRKVNAGFGFCYSPEFLALGSVIRDFLNPDLVLIGESKDFYGERVAALYQAVCENKPYVTRMSIVSAEIVKVSLGAYVTMKISFANTLSNICEAIPGADVDEITAALGSDKRIGRYYLKGGLAYGGPCFPRDSKAFAAFAEKYGCAAPLARATDMVNGVQIERLVQLTLKHLQGRQPKVSILGLAYKPETAVVDESASMILAEELLKRNIQVFAYDPLANDNARAIFGDRVELTSTPGECTRKSDVSVITTPWKGFRELNRKDFNNSEPVVIDCWRILDREALGESLRYVPLGRHS